MALDIVDKAEKVIQSLQRPDKRNPDKMVIDLTTSQIRKFLTAVNILKNKIDVYKVNHLNEDELSDDLAMEIKFLRVNILYQAKRERAVNDFVKKAQIEEHINNIDRSAAEFDRFYKYMEALVAFHKYYGGRD